ncbi:MAG: hypothetical protein FOGNACKC_00715 [Anaerolineae bacterium]|nr:hypothetical protein [Anaerolineae bacterium]
MSKRNQNFFISDQTIARLAEYDAATNQGKGPTTDKALNLYFDLLAALSQSTVVTVTRNHLGELILGN